MIRRRSVQAEDDLINRGPARVGETLFAPYQPEAALFHHPDRACVVSAAARPYSILHVGEEDRYIGVRDRAQAQR